MIKKSSFSTKHLKIRAIKNMPKKGRNISLAVFTAMLLTAGYIGAVAYNNRKTDAEKLFIASVKDSIMRVDDDVLLTFQSSEDHYSFEGKSFGNIESVPQIELNAAYAAEIEGIQVDTEFVVITTEDERTLGNYSKLSSTDIDHGHTYTQLNKPILNTWIDFDSPGYSLEDAAVDESVSGYRDLGPMQSLVAIENLVPIMSGIPDGVDRQAIYDRIDFEKAYIIEDKIDTRIINGRNVRVIDIQVNIDAIKAARDYYEDIEELEDYITKTSKREFYSLYGDSEYTSGRIYIDEHQDMIIGGSVDFKLPEAITAESYGFDVYRANMQVLIEYDYETDAITTPESYITLGDMETFLSYSATVEPLQSPVAAEYYIYFAQDRNAEARAFENALIEQGYDYTYVSKEVVDDFGNTEWQVIAGAEPASRRESVDHVINLRALADEYAAEFYNFGLFETTLVAQPSVI